MSEYLEMAKRDLLAEEEMAAMTTPEGSRMASAYITAIAAIASAEADERQAEAAERTAKSLEFHIEAHLLRIADALERIAASTGGE